MATFTELSPVTQALVATLGTWGVAAAGTALVLVARDLGRRFLDAAVGFADGRALWCGQLSGMVEPEAGVLGAWFVATVSAVLPYALAFAAGAMIFVVAGADSRDLLDRAREVLDRRFHIGHTTLQLERSGEGLEDLLKGVAR